MILNISKHLFAVWCGLVKSGYDQMDLSDGLVAMVCKNTENILLSENLLKWFAFARTDMFDVNPWYPRESCLSSACFFVDKPMEEYLDFFHSCDEPEAENPEFVRWISQLPEILSVIEHQKSFSDLYLTYADALKLRWQKVYPKARQIEVVLTLAPFSSDMQVEFIPNLLQSPYLADYAFTGDTLYVISGGLEPTSAVLHEYLHILLKKERKLLTTATEKRGVASFVDIDKLHSLGYLRSDAAHALEDCVIRALCCLALEEDAQRHIDGGFTCIKVMMQVACECDWKKRSLHALIQRMMA